MPTLVELVREQVAHCCATAGVAAPDFSDAEVLAALVLEGFCFGTPLLEWDASKHPRGQPDNAGEFAPAPGGAGAAAKKGPRRGRPLTGNKSGGRLARVRDAGRRRRVIAAYHAEAELAEAVGGYQWPDSEAQDVSIIAGPDGQLLEDPETIDHFLRLREDAVRRCREDPGACGPARDILEAPMILLECKSIQTQRGEGRIKMSAKAVARKRRAEARYACEFHTVAVDLRRRGGEKRHQLYHMRGVGNFNLSSMRKVADYSELLGALGGG